jgi:hypothetical protein
MTVIVLAIVAFLLVTIAVMVGGIIGIRRTLRDIGDLIERIPQP